MKRIALMALPLCLAATNTWAGLSATVTGATDYVAEGVSQTRSDPTHQASLDYSFENGIYVGVWASNVDYPADAGDYRNATYEQDWYGGWVYEINKDVSLDIGATRYAYSDAPGDADYSDYHLGVTVFENTTLTYHYENDDDIYRDDFDGDGNQEGGKLDWWVLEQTIPLNDDWSAGVIVNYKKAEDGTDYFGSKTGDDYTNWNLVLNHKWHDFDLQLLYSDTNINSQDDTDNVADARLVFSVSRTFDF
jgi:uncharacterized protein (TIGR02001 family)